MNPNLLKNVVRGLVILGCLLFLARFFVFIVDEREMTVVLRLGKPVREQVQPGVYFRAPFIESVRRLPKTQQFWGDSRTNELNDLPTRDQKKIDLIPWAVWKITDPTVFVQRVRTEEKAEERVAQITRSAIRDVLTKYDLAEIVRSSDRELMGSDSFGSEAANVVAEVAGEEVAAELASADQANAKQIRFGREAILQQIKEEATRRLASQSGAADGEESLGRGIAIVDVGISQIEFVDTVRSKTFDRWVAEREAISARNTTEGERLKAEIINRAKAEVARIEGEGQKIASETKGDADAQVIKRYAETIQEVGEFYTFVRTLEAYEKSMGTDSKLILTTDSDFFDLLKRLPPAAAK
ncbi:MAG: protease modulator HflC [Planctomycetota bacterium]